MPDFYRVLKADPLDGEYTPNMPGAKPVKSFWCQVEGVEEPVMMSKQVPNTPSLTEGHYGVLEDKVSSKGTKYKKFTSMQIPQGRHKPSYVAPEGSNAPVQVQADTSTVPEWFIPYARAIKEVVEYVREQRGESSIVEAANVAPASPDTATEQVKGTTLSAAELADIFGGEVTPIEITE